MGKKLREFTVWFYTRGRYGLYAQYFQTNAENVSVAIERSLAYTKLEHIFKVEAA